MVGAGGGVGLERGHRLGEMGWRERGADAPAGHRVRLAGAVDDDGALQQIVGQVQQRRRGAGAVVDPAVDLVRDDPDPVRLGPFGDGAELRQGVDRSGRVARRAEDQAPRHLVRRAIEVPCADLEPPLHVPRHQHRLGPAEMNDLGIGDPGGRGNQHSVLGSEEREAGVEDRLLGARAHHELVGIHRATPGHPAQLPRDALAQLGDPHVRRIAAVPPEPGCRSPARLRRDPARPPRRPSGAWLRY